VNAVLGHLKLAGNSLARRSWTYGFDAFGHLHHFTQRLKIPVDDTKIRLDVTGIRSADE
jgi:hypothetical protein